MDIGISSLLLLGQSSLSIVQKDRCSGRRWLCSFSMRLLFRCLFRGDTLHLILWYVFNFRCFLFLFPPMYIFPTSPSTPCWLPLFLVVALITDADENTLSLSRTPNPSQTPNRQHLLFLWSSSISWIHSFGKDIVFHIYHMKTCQCWQTMIMLMFFVCVPSRYVLIILLSNYLTILFRLAP
jgi:hypothetical protein